MRASEPQAQEAPPLMKRSRAKIWIRTAVLAVFGVLFGLAIYRDVVSGVFHWSWALMSFLPSSAIGFWMSRLVPMEVHPSSQHITLSFDRTYFALIVLLVTAKVLMGRVLSLVIWGDVIMCVILGLMVGRLGGIGRRVRHLKIRHHFITGRARRASEASRPLVWSNRRQRGE